MKRLKRIGFIKGSFIAFIGLIIISWLFILQSEPNSLSSLLDPKNGYFLKRFLSGLLGIGEEQPAFVDPNMWRTALKLSWDTFVMSILATGIASIGMLLFVLPAAKNVRDGSLTLSKRWYSGILYYISHGLFLFTRAIPELMWAMILIFILRPGILPGALALALHNFGILGKLCSEVIEDMDERPVKNLAASGASSGQLLVYAIIPDVMPKFINYILYRLENIIRATLIVGFVGASGLGLAFKLAMSFFKYSEITLYLICYLFLVYLTDFLSAMAKRYIRQ